MKYRDPPAPSQKTLYPLHFQSLCIRVYDFNRTFQSKISFFALFLLLPLFPVFLLFKSLNGDASAARNLYDVIGRRFPVDGVVIVVVVDIVDLVVLVGFDGVDDEAGAGNLSDGVRQLLPGLNRDHVFLDQELNF